MKKMMIGAALVCMVVAMNASAQPFAPSGYSGVAQSTVTSPIQAPYQETKTAQCNPSDNSCELQFPATTATTTLVLHASCTIEASVNGKSLAGLGLAGNIIDYFIAYGSNGSGLFVTNEPMFVFFKKGNKPQVISTGTGVSSMGCTITGYHS